MNQGTKKRRSADKYAQTRPVLLNSWSKDYYTLGIFCQKTNLVEYARTGLSVLRRPCEEAKLFDMGIADADEWTFRDIAFEIFQIRELTGSRFDSFIYEQAGFRVLLEIKEAVKDAHDWETEEQIKTGLEFVNLKNQPVYNQEVMEA
ncbi:MAG: hypothetical protein DRI46_11365 [Chloroflexi bacterium]|nr:MAG: hypothetical protein DRI46_11365 [Chloroflexota bacterium]